MTLDDLIPCIPLAARISRLDCAVRHLAAQCRQSPLRSTACRECPMGALNSTLERVGGYRHRRYSPSPAWRPRHAEYRRTP